MCTHTRFSSLSMLSKRWKETFFQIYRRLIIVQYCIKCWHLILFLGFTFLLLQPNFTHRIGGSELNGKSSGLLQFVFRHCIRYKTLYVHSLINLRDFSQNHLYHFLDIIIRMVQIYGQEDDSNFHMKISEKTTCIIQSIPGPTSNAFPAKNELKKLNSII